MIVINDRQTGNIEGKTATAIGVFDGMHLGHAALIGRAVADAKREGLKSAVLTFDTHPKNVMAGRRVVTSLAARTEKHARAEALGVDYLISLPFTEDIRTLNPEAFADELLLRDFNAARVYCGFNHHFGRGAEGTAKTLAEIGERKGFAVCVLPPFEAAGRVVSSSLIRAEIEAGRPETVAALLGRPYALEGCVVEGRRIGRTIGFPTLNITPDADMTVPARGVYVTECRVDGARFAAVTNVGIKPTVGQNELNVETHLLDAAGDWYGKRIRVDFLAMIREERKFSDVARLTEQIARDSEAARRYHAARA